MGSCRGEPAECPRATLPPRCVIRESYRQGTHPPDKIRRNVLMRFLELLLEGKSMDRTIVSVRVRQSDREHQQIVSRPPAAAVFRSAAQLSGIRHASAVSKIAHQPLTTGATTTKYLEFSPNANGVSPSHSTR